MCGKMKRRRLLPKDWGGASPAAALMESADWDDLCRQSRKSTRTHKVWVQGKMSLDGLVKIHFSNSPNSVIFAKNNPV